MRYFVPDENGKYKVKEVYSELRLLGVKRLRRAPFEEAVQALLKGQPVFVKYSRDPDAIVVCEQEPDIEMPPEEVPVVLAKLSIVPAIPLM